LVAEMPEKEGKHNHPMQNPMMGQDY